MMEIIKIKTEVKKKCIYMYVYRKVIENINKTKSWFVENIKKINHFSYIGNE